jgi:uncharacterized integral membrane protein (TIGR00698 family)
MREKAKGTGKGQDPVKTKQQGGLTRISGAIFGTPRPRAIIPGFLVAAAITVVAHLASAGIGRLIGRGANPFSPILLAVLLGLAVGNTVRLPGAVRDGITFGVRKLLRFGIILMGIRLSIVAVLRIGAVAVGLVALCIVAALALTIGLAGRIGISRKLGMLIAAGTSICGVSAIVATAPAIGANEEETAYAIGSITIFGLLATLAYPYLVELVLRFDVIRAGFFLGSAIHDTSQVTGASLIYDQLWNHRTGGGLSGSEIAVTTKLVRNTFLIGVVPFLASLSARSRESGEGAAARPRLKDTVPLFVAGYVILALVRTFGDLAFGAVSPAWTGIHTHVGDAATYVIAVAIACVGLHTDVRKLARLGWKPLAVGLTAAASVGVVSGVLVTLFGGLLRF